MSTVIGIFEDHYVQNKPLPVVKPGSQSRRFTHIDDTIEVCFKAWKKTNATITAFQIRRVTLSFRSPSYLNVI